MHLSPTPLPSVRFFFFFFSICRLVLIAGVGPHRCRHALRCICIFPTAALKLYPPAQGRSMEGACAAMWLLDECGSWSVVVGALAIYATLLLACVCARRGCCAAGPARGDQGSGSSTYPPRYTHAYVCGMGGGGI